MGRGGGGGGRSSGSSRSHSSSSSRGSSHSHSSGGRSSFSSGRGGSGFGGRSSFSGGRSGSYHTHHHYHGSGGGGFYCHVARPVSAFWIIFAVTLLFVLAILSSILARSSAIPASTMDRQRVPTQNAYVNDCVRDEIYWIDNESNVSRRLQEFYDKTGCQPYIYLKAYDPALTSSSACEQWTQQFYDTNFADHQNVLLYVYFCDEWDNGDGISCAWYGIESGMLMDAEAESIFWAYLDYDWDSWDTNDNDGMFVDVFLRTADRIMTTNDRTSSAKVVRSIIVIVALAGILVLLIVFRRKHQKAQETVEILNAPLHRGSTVADDLADKYSERED